MMSIKPKERRTMDISVCDVRGIQTTLCVGRYGLRRTVIGLLATIGMCYGSHASADQFHYNNLVIGDRAVGLGGAFGAVADDASGVFYNPAGLGFAISNDVSGSANAFYSRKVVYKEALGSLDFVERSRGTAPSFFGILQKLDSISKGLVFALGIFTTDSELKDQDDLVENAILESGTIVNRYHRTVNIRSTTSHSGVAVSKRFSSSLSFGIGINMVSTDELVQEYQDVNSQASKESAVVRRAQNIRQHLVASGVQSVLGVQWAFAGRFSLGLTAKGGRWFGSKLDTSAEVLQVTAAAKVAIEQNAGIAEDEDVLGDMPVEARLALAWFASTRAMLTFDAVWYDAVDDAKAPYKKDMVINLATGLEFYLKPVIAMRLGVFTNNDARPAIDHNQAGQRDSIDYVGGSIIFAWIQPTMQIAGGLVLQQGKGEAQKIGGKTVQIIEGDSRTFTFSISNSI